MAEQAFKKNRLQNQTNIGLNLKLPHMGPHTSFNFFFCEMSLTFLLELL